MSQEEFVQPVESRPGATFGVLSLVAYLLVGLGVVLVQPDTGPALWYPPLAIGMALLARGRTRWVVGVLAVELVISAVQYRGANGVVGVSLIIACCAAFECLLGAAVVRAALRHRRIETASDYLKVLLGCGVVTPFGVSLLGTAVIRAIYPDSPYATLHSAMQWWVGDGTGVCVLLPLILLWQQRETPAAPGSVGTRRELGVLGAVAMALTAWVFVSPAVLGSMTFEWQRVVCVLPLIWAAVRFRPRVAAGVILLTEIVTVVATWVVLPKLGMTSSDNELLGTQVFMIVSSVGGLSLAFAMEGERAAAGTARRALDREAGASARLEFLMTAAPTAIYSCDAQPPYAAEFMSGGSERVFGFSAEEFTREPNLWVDRLHPEDRARILAGVPAMVAQGRGVHEYRFRHKDGAYRWIRDEIAVVEREGRRLIVGHCIDVTKVKHAERVVRESEAKFQAFMSNSPVAAWITDRDGRMVYANAGFVALLGGNDPTGRTLEEVFPPEMAAAYRKNNDSVLASGKMQDVVETALRPDGSLGRFLAYKFPFQIDDGVIAVGGAAFDITERERQAEALREAERRAQAANLAKSEFLANMSHELRTPLTAILGFAELLGEAELTPAERVEHVETIRRNGEHLLAVISDILDLSKIEAGRLTIERLPTDPTKLVHDVVNLMQVRAGAKGITLGCSVASNAPATIPTDPVRLRQILMNLIANAIKFTPSGSVHVRISADDKVVRFEVRDTGIGMTPEQMTRLFKPFEQGDPSVSRLYGGTGLGLRISERLARILDGSISVDSAAGRGSVFTLSLPAGEGRAEGTMDSKLAEITVHLRGASVLVVEDGPDNQRLLDHILTRAGARVTLAANGLEGLAALGLHRETSPTTVFDLIICDIQMPEMDGHELVRRIRAAGVRTPVLALTANAMTGEAARALESGCDEFAAKPLDRFKLLTLCNELLGPSSRPEYASKL
ncbi:MAG: response regulator [Phycisphaerales bacterium]|nr:response regulator [Phycisphaerales bacterium]